MTVRVHLLPLYDAPADPIDVPDGTRYETQATNGAGLIADVYSGQLIATFANVRYVEIVDDGTPAQKLPGLVQQVELARQVEAQEKAAELARPVEAREPLVYGEDWDCKPVTVPSSEAKFINGG